MDFTEIKKSMLLTKALVNAIDEVDENLSYKHLAESVAFIMHEYYSEDNRQQFLKTLKNLLT
tara:strand:+ start:461 stop:646 length:186 start_codon:yes stop_codon:yes gene_type:complete